MAAGLKIGVYYYSYALDEPAARSEARYMISVLKDAGLTKDKIEMGLWFDMEDADGYKSGNGMPTNQTITNMCSAFIVVCNEAGYSCGIYANLDWLEIKFIQISWRIMCLIGWRNGDVAVIGRMPQCGSLLIATT